MIIWLASYPKSGNTWVRSFISSLLYTNDGKVSFSKLNKIGQFPARSQFLNFIDDLQNVKEVYKNWSSVQNYLNLDNKIKFLKTHHINCKIENYEFTDQTNTLGVIYIVRDPRNVACSVKNHFSLNNYEEVKNFLFRENNWLGIIKDRDQPIMDNKIPTLISSWKTNYLSWKNKTKNYLLIKYENLLNDPNNEFFKISKYLENHLKINISKEKVNKAIESCSFKNLQKLEIEGKFQESTVDKDNNNVKFFHLGPENDWRKKLDKEISKAIEEQFQEEMKELKYIC
tara:strand:+ start:512 stop:1366 length:855 start_codon:yes stop_codon:yes gene_type:complete